MPIYPRFHPNEVSIALGAKGAFNSLVAPKVYINSHAAIEPIANLPPSRLIDHQERLSQVMPYEIMCFDWAVHNIAPKILETLPLAEISACFDT